jgi:uncharacterized protein (DUF1810 family)
MSMDRDRETDESVPPTNVVDDAKTRNWRHYGQHTHGLPCASDCTIYGVDNPVEGDLWMLERFVVAQNDHGVYGRAIQELRSKKTTDWIWFVFPQLWGLAKNYSPESLRYGLRRRAEAQAYAEHPLLFPRLVTATQTLLSNERPLDDVMPKHIDRVKLRSSMTLFGEVGSAPGLFSTVIERYFNGVPDEQTLKCLAVPAYDEDDASRF